MLQPIGDPGQRRPQRLAQDRLASILVEQPSEERQVRLLGLVLRGERRHPLIRGGRLAGARRRRRRRDGGVTLETRGQIAEQFLQHVALALEAVLQILVRVLDHHVERPRRADLRAREI